MKNFILSIILFPYFFYLGFKHADEIIEACLAQIFKAEFMTIRIR